MPPPEKPECPLPPEPRIPLEKLGRPTLPRLPRLAAGIREPPEKARPRPEGPKLRLAKARPAAPGREPMPWRATTVREGPRWPSAAGIRVPELTLPTPRCLQASLEATRPVVVVPPDCPRQ